MNIDKCLTVSVTLSNNWYIQLHTILLTYPDNFSINTILEIKSSSHTNADIIDIWDDDDFLSLFFNNIDNLNVCNVISNDTPLKNEIIEENKTILKELWQEHLFLKNIIIKKIYENTNPWNIIRR